MHTTLLYGISDDCVPLHVCVSPQTTWEYKSIFARPNVLDVASNPDSAIGIAAGKASHYKMTINGYVWCNQVRATSLSCGILACTLDAGMYFLT